MANNFIAKLIAWFSNNYPNLKKSMQNCEHGEGDINPYHIEGDCWSHTMMVCKVAEIKQYEPIVQVAALLHDIGKPASRKINSKNNHVQFFGHEELSANIAKPILKQLVAEGYIVQEELSYIHDLIKYHGLVYKKSKKELKEKFKEEFFNHLMDLNVCDNLGRFTQKY